MAPRYRAALALTLALAATLAASAALPKHRHRGGKTEPASRLTADELYSRRALRKARIILELKLMELRAERLERVRKALERHLPIDKLLEDGPLR